MVTRSPQTFTYSIKLHDCIMKRIDLISEMIDRPIKSFSIINCIWQMVSVAPRAPELEEARPGTRQPVLRRIAKT